MHYRKSKAEPYRGDPATALPWEKSRTLVFYARVSSVRQEQDGHLAQQTARLQEAATSRGYEVVLMITEQASSLNERRKGMKQLLSLIGEQTVVVVLIENPDRLVRFGLDNLKQAFRWKDVCLEVYEPPKHQQPTEELMGGHVSRCDRVCRQAICQRAKDVRKRVETVRKRM